MIPPKIFPFQLREAVSTFCTSEKLYFFTVPSLLETWEHGYHQWLLLGALSQEKQKWDSCTCVITPKKSGGNSWWIMTHLFSATPVYKPCRSHHCYQPFTEGTWQLRPCSAARIPSLVNHSGFARSPLIRPLSLLYMQTVLAHCTGMPIKWTVLPATVRSWSLLENSSFPLTYSASVSRMVVEWEREAVQHLNVVLEEMPVLYGGCYCYISQLKGRTLLRKKLKMFL